jgi:sugar (pentulose or hexulose) kinase
VTAGLGIDVGLSGVRAAVVDQHGALVGTGRAGSGARLISDRAEADPREWLLGALAAGGATRNVSLLHACCDALGRPLDVMPHAGAAIGPAALALRAAGATWQPSPERTIESDTARTARLAELLGTYRGAYAGLAPTMHALGRKERCI